MADEIEAQIRHILEAFDRADLASADRAAAVERIAKQTMEPLKQLLDGLAQALAEQTGKRYLAQVYEGMSGQEYVLTYRLVHSTKGEKVLNFTFHLNAAQKGAVVATGLSTESQNTIHQLVSGNASAPRQGRQGEAIVPSDKVNLLIGVVGSDVQAHLM